MNIPGEWLAVGAVAVVGALVVLGLSVFTGVSETVLMWVGVFFGGATGIAIMLAGRESGQSRRRAGKKR